MKIEKNKSKFKNPLSGIPTKSLLITFFALLLTFAIGFGTGFGCSARAEIRGSSTVTAYAAERSFPNTQTDVVIISQPNIVVTGRPTLYQASSAQMVGYNVTSSSSLFDVNLPPLSNMGLRSISLGYSGLPPSMSTSYIGMLSLDCYRDFDSFRTNTGGDPYIGLSFQSVVNTNSGFERQNSFYTSIPCFYSGADATSSDELFGTFSGERIIRNYQNNSTSTVSYRYSVSYLDTSSLPLASLNVERTVYLMQPISAVCYPSYVNSSTNPYLQFYIVLRFYFANTLPLSSNSWVDISYAGNFITSSYVSFYNFLPVLENYFTFEISPESSELQARYDAGYSDGVISGKTQGYNEGLTAGYDNGYSAGVSSKLEDITPWQHIVNGVNTFLNLQLLPGVRISVILTITFGLILIGFLLKFYLGG